MIVWLCVSPFYLEFGVLDVLEAVSQWSYVCGDNSFQDAIPTLDKDSNNNLPKRAAHLICSFGYCVSSFFSVCFFLLFSL